MNGDSNSGPPQLLTIHGPNPEEISFTTLGEIKTIISRLKNHKSPGSDEWNESIVCPIYKKGDLKESELFLAMSVLGIPPKLVKRFLGLWE